MLIAVLALFLLLINEVIASGIKQKWVVSRQTQTGS